MVKIIEILKIIYLLLPGYFANMSTAYSSRINFLNYPLDFKKKFFGERVFGNNKTFRGIFFGILTAIVMAFIQYLLNISSLNILDYNNFLIIGLLLGAGALIGDLAKSFFKRRLKIKPGKPFIPFDQIDHVIGSLLLLSIIYPISLNLYFIASLITFPLHIIINYLAYKLKLKDTYW
mgnify:FL=1